MIGVQLGPYQIVGMLGAGGMGEVYRARDVRLKRDVALKILPDSFAADPDRLARFQREAEVLASLNHPHIAQIYGLEEAASDNGTVRAIAMELVEGDTLADRLAKGRLPLGEAVTVAKQIADALDAAHDRGIVHRDLKPANIKLTPAGVVKVLDFGLAKALGPAEAGRSAQPGGVPRQPHLTASPTITSPAMMTGAGLILGTAAYMSPEQARGRPVDTRADIWAFGVILYEMLTGRALFDGDTVTDVLAGVVTKEPDLTAVPWQTRRLLAKCLQKDPGQRLRHIGDAWALLDTDDPERRRAAPHDTGMPFGRRLPWAVAGLVAAAAGAMAIVHFGEAAPDPPATVRFQLQAALEAGSNAPAISPDGRRIVYQTSRGIFVRDIDAVEPRLLTTTDNPIGSPFWSADSRSVAYATSSKLMRVDATGGPSQSICDLPGILQGGVWTPDDRILFGVNGRTYAVSAQSGPVSEVKLRAGARLSGHQVLPDGQRFVYAVGQGADGARGIFVGRLDGVGEPLRLLPDSESGVAFAAVPGEPGGYLFFVRQGSLVAQAMDPARAEISGDPIVVAAGVESFSASAAGDLVYGEGTAGRQLMWFDREGKNLGTAWASGRYLELSLSPDGSRVAVVRGVDEARAAAPAIWLHEFSREASTRLVASGSAVKPIWAPDGKTLVFSSSGRDGLFDLHRAASGGEVKGTPLFIESSTFKYPNSWSRDGRWLMYTSVAAETKEDLWVLPVGGERSTPEPFLVTDYSETDAAFSPDGRFVAYVSNESGVSEVYVRAFPAGIAGKWAISNGGGYQPRWSSDGRELFYISGKSELMTANVMTGASFSTASPRRLFPVPIYGGGASLNNRYWDVTPDGQRFLVTTTGEGTGASTLTVVLNWRPRR